MDILMKFMWTFLWSLYRYSYEVYVTILIEFIWFFSCEVYMDILMEFVWIFLWGIYGPHNRVCMVIIMEYVWILFIYDTSINISHGHQCMHHLTNLQYITFASRLHYVCLILISFGIIVRVIGRTNPPKL